MSTPAPTTKKKSWQGKAEVLMVIDGDTFKVFVDLGFQIFTRLNVRVHGINCPELSEKWGISARDFTAMLLKPGEIVTLDSKRLDLHGRAEAIVTLPDGRDLSKVLLEAGHAVPANDRGNL
jgi:endonuclease YncB( thermonuclease family)